MFIEMATVIANNPVAEDIYEILLHAPKIVEESYPGQFVQVFLKQQEHLLPRPISICGADKEKGELRLIYQVVGKGTTHISNITKGKSLKLMGPVGNGFPTVDAQKIILLGGGIGAPPLLMLAQKLAFKTQISAYLGFREQKRIILSHDFIKAGVDTHIATDDGSVGFHGNAVDFLKRDVKNTDVIYACGPKVMLKYLSEYAITKNIKCYVSMEERMACGVGACLGCVVRIKGEKGSVYKKVCSDGPVFSADEVVWDGN